jgi:D-glycerate 3-kinase
MTLSDNRREITLTEFARLFHSESDKEIAQNFQENFINLLNSMQLPDKLKTNLGDLYIPFINLLESGNYLQSGRPKVIGISGSQGSGKSTFTALLSHLFENQYGYRVVSFSIDDFYHKRETREILSRTIHPLLITRGVPGTHDVRLALDVFKNLLNARDSSVTNIPIFDKSIDDRKPTEEWRQFKGLPDIILFEGWCVGAAPQSPKELSNPLNNLEREHDQNKRFRTFVNDQLSGDYRKWFSMIDFLVMLKVPSFKQVHEWRWLQEQKLKEKTKAESIQGKKLRIMTEEELKFFISHYERITRHMLKEMPSRADLVLEVGTDHCFKKIYLLSQT